MSHEGSLYLILHMHDINTWPMTLNTEMMTTLDTRVDKLLFFIFA